MKKIYVFLCLLLCAVALQAQINARVMPPDDPNLDPNWDWTVTVPGQGHLMYYLPPGGSITQTYAQTPFRKNGEDFFVYNEAVADMYKEDGWMLVYRDFGTPTNAPTIPFFVLYNKYRGLLRVFALNTPGNRDSFYEMKLLFRSNSPKPAIFTLSDSDATKRFLDNFNSSGVLRYVGVTTPGGWYYGEFNIAGYDPNIPISTVFSIQLDGINASRIQLSGSLVAQGGITLEGIIKGTGNLSGYYPSQGNNSASFLNKGEKYFSAADKTIEALNKIKSKKGDQGLLTAATFLPKVGPVIGAIGAVLSLINTFIGGNDDSNSREPISFNMDLTQDASFRGDITLEGTLNLSGSIETNLPVWRSDFAMSALNTTQALYKPIQTIPWGVVNLKSSILNTIITREGGGTGSYFIDGSNCSWNCPCGYTSGFEEQGSYYYCNCPEQLVCDQIEQVYSTIDRDYKHKIRFLVNSNLGITLLGVKLIYQLPENHVPTNINISEYELPISSIGPTEFEVTTPNFNYYFDPYFASLGNPNPFNNIKRPKYLVFFFKINSPIRNSDDEIVIIEKIEFSAEQITTNIGGRLAAVAEFKIERDAVPDPYVLGFPNPTKSSSKIEFSVEETGSGNLQIFDFNGKKIKTLIDNQEFKKGRYRMFWDGKDGNGQPIADGIYVCKLSIGSQTKSIRVVKQQ